MNALIPAAMALLAAALAPAQGSTRQGFTSSSSSQPRFVDFHLDLDRPGVRVIIGQLGRMKEGKRARLREGRLGGGGSVTQISGTQYFKVPVKATIQPDVTLLGKPKQKVKLEFAIQLARLPDGSERRQTLTESGVQLTEETLAMFVVAPPAKGKKAKGLELLQVIPFDKQIDKGADAKNAFVDTMRDYYDVNRRMADIKAALAAFDAAVDKTSTKAALARLAKLSKQTLEMRISNNDGLLRQHVAPLEARMKKRLAGTAGKR